MFFVASPQESSVLYLFGNIFNILNLSNVSSTAIKAFRSAQKLRVLIPSQEAGVFV